MSANPVFKLLFSHRQQRAVRVPLTQGMFALVAACDWPKVAGRKWYAHRDRNTYYAVAHVYAGGKQKTVPMHRLISDAPAGAAVDHKNGNGLDNRQSNLRLATNSQNSGNQRLTNRNTSGFKGVSWDAHAGKWNTRIRVRGRLNHLGYYNDPVESAKAYDTAAREHFGRFACVNFPQPGERRCHHG